MTQRRRRTQSARLGWTQALCGGILCLCLGSGVAMAQTPQAKLTASDGAAGDNFGVGVAISGDTLVVGAFADDAGAGSAYVYTRTGGVWTQQAKLTAADGAAGDLFGISVAVSGDTAVVGAYGDDATALNSGSAYVFLRTGEVWTQQPRLTAADGADEDQFGISVAVSGDTAVVGAYGDDATAINSGSAYVYVGAAVGRRGRRGGLERFLPGHPGGRRGHRLRVCLRGFRRPAWACRTARCGGCSGA